MERRDIISRARRIAEMTIDGEFDPLLASRELVLMKNRLPNADSPAWEPLEGVASEVDGLPLGDERRFWAPEALREKDQEADSYRSLVKDVVRDALQALFAASSY